MCSRIDLLFLTSFMVVLVLINPYIVVIFLSLIFETNGLRLTLKSLFTPPTNKLF